MSDSIHSTILRRMTGQQAVEEEDVPLTWSRALRLALTKAANDTVGLVLTVTTMAETEHSFDDLLSRLESDLMLIALYRDGGIVGVMALDMQFRAAVLEMQTMGQLIDAVADDRAPTGTDKTMCEPVLDRFLTSLPAAFSGTEFDGWVDDIELGPRLDSGRAAGLILKDRDYRILNLEVDLNIAERQGRLFVALPVAAVDVVPEVVVDDPPDWHTQFQQNVMDAPSELDAELHRFSLPLSTARALHVGQVIPLRGCTVSSVKLRSPDGHEMAQAKLGQLGGMRAVRVEAAPLPQMHELSGGPLAQPVEMMSPPADAQPALMDIEPIADEGGLAASPIEMDLPDNDLSEPDLGDGLAMAPMDIDMMSD